MTTKLKQRNVKLAIRGPAELTADGGEYTPTVEYKEVKALVSTKIPFAVTGYGETHYALTHVPSGYTFGPHFGTQKAARAALEILEDVSADYPGVWAWMPTDTQRSLAAEFKRRLTKDLGAKNETKS